MESSLRSAATPRIPPWALVGLMSGAAAAGMLLYGAPLEPDAAASWWHWAGAFLIFLAWSLGVLGWGLVLTAVFKVGELLGWAAPVALGAGLASLAAGGLGLLGFIGPEHRLALALLVAAGPLLALRFEPSRKTRGREPRTSLGWGYVPWALFAFFVLSNLVGGAAPFRGVDEYRYHLLGPRLWSDAGHIFRPSLLPIAFRCASWEDLFLWGDAFLGGPRGAGLVAGQLFGRWVHAGVGYLGAGFALAALMRPYARDRAWLALAVLAGAADLSLGWTAWQAKNDWGGVLWALSGLAILFAPGTRSKGQLTAAGALLGLGFTAKFSAMYLIAPALACWSWRRPLRLIAACAAGFAVASLPILARNWFFVGDPFFPFGGALFDSRWVGPRLAWHIHKFYGFAGLHPSLWFTKLALLLKGSPAAAVFLVLPLLATRVRSLKRFWLPWSLAAVALAWFVVAVGAGFDDTIRLLGPGVPIIAATGVFVVGELAGLLAERRAARSLRAAVLPAVGVALALLLAASPLVTSTVPWRAWPGLARLPDSATLVRDSLVAGDAKAWLRAHVAPDRLIFTTGDDHLYYDSFLLITELDIQPEAGWATLATWDVTRLVGQLRELGGEYLLDSAHWTGDYWTTTSRRFNRFVLAYPGTLVFVGRASFVVDLSRLDDAISRACVARARRPYAPYLGAAPPERDAADSLNHYK